MIEYMVSVTDCGNARGRMEGRVKGEGREVKQDEDLIKF
jgi:hypothetical protein